MRNATEEQSFGKPDAFTLLTRLAAQWPYLIEDDTRKAGLLAEFVAQFDGYDPAKVMDAATVVIGRATKFAPTAGEIKAELRSNLSPTRGSWRADEDSYRPNTPEEVERRKLLCAQWRKQHGLVPESQCQTAADESRPIDRGFSEAEISNARALRERVGGRV